MNFDFQSSFIMLNTNTARICCQCLCVIKLIPWSLTKDYSAFIIPCLDLYPIDHVDKYITIIYLIWSSKNFCLKRWLLLYTEGEYVFSSHQFFASLDIWMYPVRIVYQLKCTNQGPVLSSCFRCFTNLYIIYIKYLYIVKK